ncbi:hypothetical protein B484DRAFT_448803 [Ochromonadaceae sp. CCMP2298]|nr:hypothetical protein B484DRAFT_448803 [Ochromonadaceae sp. CCMP2298]|mmetsp:Transcript_27341/g.60528  ORF Transcript_27341/g.60528 Transcript_27341/m.60528 type:complete len:403 (+) Transcript_27341:185-1393(+)
MFAAHALLAVVLWAAVVTARTGVTASNSNSTKSAARRYYKTEFSKANPHSVEVMLLHRETEVFGAAVKSAQEQGFSIQGFYHTSTWQPKWASVVTDQLKLLDGFRHTPVNVGDANSSYEVSPLNWTSLLAASDGLYLNVAGPTTADLKKVQQLVNTLPLRHKDKIQFNFNTTVGRDAWGDAKRREALMKDAQLSAGEHSTVQALQRYCQRKVDSGEKAIVYYFHSKSGCCHKPFNSRESNPRASWREYMNAFSLEFPSVCLRAMLAGYSTCGVENQDAHYSGNFWWADCAHVASLSPSENRFDAWSAEFYVQKYSVDFSLARRIGYHCGYSAFNCGLNLYDFDCSREKYRDRLYKLVMGRQLAPSFRGAPHSEDDKRCGDIRGPSYNKNQIKVRAAFVGVKA